VDAQKNVRFGLICYLDSGLQFASFPWQAGIPVFREFAIILAGEDDPEVMFLQFSPGKLSHFQDDLFFLRAAFPNAAGIHAAVARIQHHNFPGNGARRHCGPNKKLTSG
jgi:hypothetical protein